jgi:hypothetical protein
MDDGLFIKILLHIISPDEFTLSSIKKHINSEKYLQGKEEKIINILSQTYRPVLDPIFKKINMMNKADYNDITGYTFMIFLLNSKDFNIQMPEYYNCYKWLVQLLFINEQKYILKYEKYNNLEY